MTGYEKNFLLCSIIESPSFMNSLVQFSFQIRQRRCDSVKFWHFKDRGIGMALWRAILGSKLSSETANIYEFHVRNEKLQVFDNQNHGCNLYKYMGKLLLMTFVV